MCRTSVTAILLLAAIAAGTSRSAAAAEAEPPVTPFLDSGNTLPNLAARTWPRLGTWYGWQILVADLAPLACAVGLDQPLCLIPVAVSGPAIHLAHGRRGLAGVSIGIRLTAITIGAAMGASTAKCEYFPGGTETTPLDGGTVTRTWGDSYVCGHGHPEMGAMIGAAVAAVVDAAIGFTRLSPEAPAAPEATRRPARAITPRVSFGQTGVSLGLGAAF